MSFTPLPQLNEFRKFMGLKRELFVIRRAKPRD
jgi:hypothetical protein